MNADNVAGSGVASGGSGASTMAADQAAGLANVTGLKALLVEGALPGKVADFTDKEQQEAAAFVALCAQRRPRGLALVRLESMGGQLGQRRMRIGIVNDDMPFLVDSIAMAITARGLIIHRLLHPVVCVERDDQDNLKAVHPLCDNWPRRESMMYLEVDRADARDRRELVAELHHVLADVRAAVTDWEQLQEKMRSDAETIRDDEGKALLRWFADGAMTLLGRQVECPHQRESESLGVLRIPGEPLWGEGSCAAAISYFEQGGQEPLVAKSDRLSSVHR